MPFLDKELIFQIEYEEKIINKTQKFLSSQIINLTIAYNNW